MTTPDLREKQFAHRLTQRGYLMQEGIVQYIANDDTDQGLELVAVGEWPGSMEDLYWMLDAFNWPTKQAVLSLLSCQLCLIEEANASGYCHDCQQIINAEERGERELETARDREAGI